jgi:TRAP transporter TAXI family solute receptor
MLPRESVWACLAAGVVLTALTGCAAPAAAPPVTLTIATGSTAGVYYPLGISLAQILSARIPRVQARAIPSGASTDNVLALENGSADVAFALGDVAYFAYTEGTRLKAERHRRLRSMAVLYTNAVHFIVPASSRIRTLRDLAGTRLAWGVAMPTPGRSRSIDVLIQAHGVEAASVTAHSASFEQILSGLLSRTLDVGVISAGYPVPAIERAAKAGLRFLNVDPEALQLIQQDYQFFIPFAVPGNTYSGQPSQIDTVGIDNVLLCREDLDEDLVYRLTKAFFEALPELAATHPAAGLIDADVAPATALPLHPGAARYYRERELLLY